MKKIICLLITGVLIIGMLAGCSSGPTEEELRAEVEAEMAAEAEMEAEIRAELEAEMAAEKAAENDGLLEDKESSESSDSAHNNSVDTDSEPQGNTEKEEEIVWLEGTGVEIKVIASSLNVRDDSSTSGNVVASVNEGEIYEIIETDADSGEDYLSWYMIQLDDGTAGWVAGWYCVEYSGGSTVVGRENLEPAFKGYMDGVEVAVGRTPKDVIDVYGMPYDADGAMGGLWMYYDSYMYSFGTDGDYTQFDYNGANDNLGGEVFSITLRGSYMTDDEDIYGINDGMDKTGVRSVLGEPDYTVDSATTEDGPYDVNWDVYVTGSYVFVVRYEVIGADQVTGYTIADSINDVY